MEIVSPITTPYTDGDFEDDEVVLNFENLQISHHQNPCA